jgi:hypothetical protein
MFWLAMFDHELKDQEYESGIMSALAVLGLNAIHNATNNHVHGCLKSC